MFDTINHNVFFAIYVERRIKRKPVLDFNRLMGNSTKIMPRFINFLVLAFSTLFIFGVLMQANPVRAEQTAINTYYIRYDIKSSKHQITDENLLMVPAKNEFRTAKFSLISLPCVISMTPGESKNQIQQRAKNQALKSILLKEGLKSVKSKNWVTIISYEGVIISPIDIIGMQGNDPAQFAYTAQFGFSPLAFPDQWQNLKFTTTIKEKLNDFFSFFK
jgi:hypothetical protein